MLAERLASWLEVPVWASKLELRCKSDEPPSGVVPERLALKFDLPVWASKLELRCVFSVSP